MNWRPYSPCCRLRALDSGVRICPDCGHPLLRCGSFAECEQILSPGDHCPVHVAPQVYLAPEGPSSAKVGDRVSLPVLFRNTSACGSELMVRTLYAEEPGSNLREIPLVWEKLRASETKALSVDTEELRSGGNTRVTLFLVTSVPSGGMVENYAFAADIALRVNRDKSKIIQNIHVEGGHFAAGASAVVQTGPSVREGFGAAPEPKQTVREISTQRAEAFELRRGIRGYAEREFRIHRDVEVACEGFPEDEAPKRERPFLSRRSLLLGRNSLKLHEQNPRPNDISLRAWKQDGSGLDRERTFMISGVHLELFLANDRLHLRGLGRNGTWLGAKMIRKGETAVLASGDRIRPLAAGHGGPELEVKMAAVGGSVERITLSRRDSGGSR